MYHCVLTIRERKKTVCALGHSYLLGSKQTLALERYSHLYLEIIQQ